jgi:hypothetical protein
MVGVKRTCCDAGTRLLAAAAAAAVVGRAEREGGRFCMFMVYNLRILFCKLVLEYRSKG